MAFVQAILSKFDRYKKTGDGWMARCPCHDDSTESLHVSIKGDKVLLKCHGCGADARSIMSAIGMEVKDLFLSSSPIRKSTFEIIEVYDYFDEAGQLAYQNCRIRTDKEAKTFRVRRPRRRGEEGGGRDPKWFWGLERNLRRYPYHLADLLAAAKGSTVYINNGEKSVNRFRANGLISTCSVGGEGKWPDVAEFNQYFRDFHLVLLADNDPCKNEIEPRKPAVLCGREFTNKADCKGIGGTTHRYNTSGTCKNVVTPEVPAVLCGHLISDRPKAKAGKKGLALVEGDRCRGKGGPDHSYTGLNHVRDVCSKAMPYALSVKILTAVELGRCASIPRKGDGWDFFENGGTVQDLEALVAAAPASSIKTDGNGSGGAAQPIAGVGGLTHDLLREYWLRETPPTVYRSGLEKGGFYRYSDGTGVWAPIGKYLIRKELLAVIERSKTEKLKPNSTILNSVYELAAAATAVPDEIFDVDRDYLVCGNGSLFIPERRLDPHKKEIYATAGVNYDYNPKAKAPYWKKYIDRLSKLLSPAVVGFLQEYAGLCLTTETKYEIVLWLQGHRGSGKSTFILGLASALGDRCSILGLADIDESRFMLSTLPGKTLAWSTEQPAQFGRGFAVVNAIASGEPIQIDRKFRDPLTIQPYAKLLWAMNDLPVIREPNSGLWRRLKIVRFPKLPRAERDEDLKKAIVEDEGPAILNWALDGLERLRQRNRFDIPPAVDLAVQQYEAENDIPAVFVRECCFVGDELADQITRKLLKNVGCPGQAIYDAYVAWCQRTGHKPLSTTRIADDWRRFGFEKYEVGGRTRWRGVALRPDIGIADGALLDEGKKEKHTI